MDDPHFVPIYAIALISLLAAILIPGNAPARVCNRLYFLAFGACASFFLVVSFDRWGSDATQYVLENPYDIPIFVAGIVSGAVAGLMAASGLLRLIHCLYVLALGTCLSWLLLVPSVEWEYSHPFNPDDGGPITGALLFGWLAALVWPTLPTFFTVLGIRFLSSRALSWIGKQGGSAKHRC